MAIEISPAPEAEKIAKDLIPEVHAELLEAGILYLFTTQERKKHGSVVLGTAQKLSGLSKYLSSGNAADIGEGYDFIIMIGEAEWQGLDSKGRRALVDHELCHCKNDGEDKEGNTRWTLRAHDVEEFREIIERHGLWKSDLKEFGLSARQLALVEAPHANS